MGAAAEFGPKPTDRGLEFIQRPTPTHRLSLIETGTVPLVAPWSEHLGRNELQILVFEDLYAGSRAAAIDAADILNPYQLYHEPYPLAAWSATGTSYETVWPEFIRSSKQMGLDLGAIEWGHLDNYAFRRERYPDGPNKFDYPLEIRERLIIPAGIPEHMFHPIDTWVPEANLPRVAAEYQALFERLKPVLGFFGLGPTPEVHLAYMLQNTPLDLGYHYLPELSPATNDRNRIARQEDVPTAGISMGPANVRALRHKIVCAWGKPNEVAAAFCGPINSNEVVASMLRLPDFRTGTQVYLDMQSAMPLLNLVNTQ